MQLDKFINNTFYTVRGRVLSTGFAVDISFGSVGYGRCLTRKFKQVKVYMQYYFKILLKFL